MADLKTVNSYWSQSTFKIQYNPNTFKSIQSSINHPNSPSESRKGKENPYRHSKKLQCTAQAGRKAPDAPRVPLIDHFSYKATQSHTLI